MARRDKRPPSSAGAEERIVFAAMRLFAEKGYGSTSVADILVAADANPGSLYHYFPGKQDVLIAVLQLYLGGIHPMLLEPAWRDVDDPIERVFALLAAYRRALVSTHETYGCPIGSIALELHEPDEQCGSCSPPTSTDGSVRSRRASSTPAHASRSRSTGMPSRSWR
jgi:TetR/AcrR family transcriptional repressor of nem operon